MVDFNALLSTKVEETQKPKPMPVGTYVSSITRHEFGESKNKKTPYVRFFHKPLSPMPDVDTEALNALPNWQDKEFRNDFYLTDDAMFRLRDFLENSLKMPVAGMTYSEMIPATTGMSCLVKIKHEINGEDIFATIESTAAA